MILPLISVNIPCRVTSGGHIFNRPISGKPTKCLGIKTEYIPKAVVPLFNCLAYDWMVKDD